MHKYGPVIKMLSLVTQIGITMLTSVFLCMAIGMWIDKHFSTNLFLLFLILGIMGGIRGVYSLIHNILEQEDMEDKDGNKLRQLDETYLDLVIGILLCGVLSAILGMIITRGDLRYLIGAIVGTIFALVMITTMMVSIQKSVQMDTHQASRNMIKSALIRYVATLVILYVMIKLSMSAFIAALVGFLSSKFAAFLQKPIHEHITRRVLQE